jgi:hypothetical protein
MLVFPNLTSQEINDVLSGNVSVISFLIGTASFVIGLYRFKLVSDRRLLTILTLSLVLPSAGLTIYRFLLIIGFVLYATQFPVYLAVSIPIAVILYLVSD